MDKFLRPEGLTALDKEIARLVTELSNMDVTSDMYNQVASNLRLLTEAREKKNDRTISMETLLQAGVTVVGLLLVLNFEKTGVITSKAFSMLRFGK